mgnify:CR=1 FL=1
MRLGSLAFEILPLAAFFVGNATQGLFFAAAASVAAALLVLVVAWTAERRLAVFSIFSVVLSGVLTVAAILLSDAVLIKIQPTVFNGLFSAALLIGILAGVPVMRLFFGGQFRLTERTWRLLSLRWGLYTGAVAIGNEIAWRTLSDDGWVIVKVAVIPALTVLFALSQLPLTLKGRLDAGERLQQRQTP